MIFKWPLGCLDHWHLFKRKLLYCALGYLTLDWHSDNLTDSERVKSGRLGERCKRQTEGQTGSSNRVINSMAHRYGDALVQACNSGADGAGWIRERKTRRRGCEDMRAYIQRDSQVSLKPETCPSIQEQSQSAPVGVWPQCNLNTHIPSHTPCSSFRQAADTEVLVIAVLMVWWLISPSYTLCVSVG